MENKQNNKPWNIPAQNKARQRKVPAAVSAVVATLCIIIYLGALVQATVRLFLCVESGRMIAEEEFSKIAEIAFHAGGQGLVDHRFEETMKNALDSSRMIEALIITGLDPDCAVEKQKDYAVTWSNNTPKFKNRFSFSNHIYYRPVPIKGLQGVNIRAVANAFDYNEITRILKDTLLLIIIGFLISFFTMLIQFLTGKKEVPAGVKNSGVIYGQSADSGTDFFEDDFSSNGPKGLYSERSGLGWEEYIEERLDYELHRCSSSDRDLAFILLEFTNLTNDNMFKQSAREADAYLTSKDMLFEYGRWGIAAILPGISLDKGIKTAEKYYQRMLDKFPHGYNQPSGICIGLTSRSGRLLNASRIMLEASEALKKSKEENTIIAFKSDPEKYRDFISKQS